MEERRKRQKVTHPPRGQKSLLSETTPESTTGPLPPAPKPDSPEVNTRKASESPVTMVEKNDYSQEYCELRRLIAATVLQAALHIQEGRRQEEAAKAAADEAVAPSTKRTASISESVPATKNVKQATSNEDAETTPDTNAPAPKKKRRRRKCIIPASLRPKKRPVTVEAEYVKPVKKPAAQKVTQDTSIPTVPKRKRRRQKCIIPRELRPKKKPAVTEEVEYVTPSAKSPTAAQKTAQDSSDPPELLPKKEPAAVKVERNKKRRRRKCIIPRELRYKK